MKLIGGHDYYDGAGYGVDESVVFVRNKRMHLADVDGTSDHPFTHLMPWEFDADAEGISGSLRPFLVVVAGKIYPGLQEVRRHWRASVYQGDERIYHYDPEEALAAYDCYADRMRSVIFTRETGYDNRRDRKERLKTHFKRVISKSETSWLIDRHVTVLSTHVDEFSSRDGIQARINHACLKDLHFFRALDPFTLHMEVQGWISGVLPFEQNIIELADKDKIRKAGFDLKASFRTRAGKKARHRNQ